MNKKKIFNYIAIILIVVGLVAAFYNASQRFAVERSHRETEILLDWTQVMDTAQRADASTQAVLANLPSEHVGGIFMKEMLLQDLENEGKVSFFNGLGFLSIAEEYNIAVEDVDVNHSYLVFSGQAEMDRVAKHIEAKVSGAFCEKKSAGDGIFILQTSVPDNDFATLGLGFSADNLQLIQDAGLNAAVQIRFWGDCDEKGIDAVMSDFAGFPIVAVGFNDAYVPGSNFSNARWKELKQYWVASVDSLETDLMTVEFFNQKGLPNLAMAMDNHVLRCHALTETDAAALSEEALIDRFTLAASERNMKLLVVRLPFKVQVDEQQDFFNALADSLWTKGVVLKIPSPTVDFAPSPLTVMLCCLGIIGGGWLLMGRLRFRPSWKVILAIIFTLAMAGLLVLGNVDLLQRSFALLSVVVFPTLAIISFVPKEKQKLGKALLLFILMTLVSLVGAVLMVGVLSDGNFMLMLKQFAGVKVAHLLPLLIVAFWAILLADKNQSPMLSCKKVLAKPVNIAMVVLGCVLLAVIAFYLMRTGNDNPNAVSGLERSFRAAMDNLMGVRPRTKEFLLGHPLMLFLCFWGYRNHFYLPVLLLAAIGQVSMVNTFAHIHTPLMVSGLRTINGLVLGIIGGLILIAVICLIVKCVKKKKAIQG